MEYNGLGQRLQMTAYAGGLSLATHYVLDSQRGAAPLIATANSQSTYYLYGLEAVAERASAWSYYLRDGLGSLRRVADSNADILYERSYTPWGDVLSQSGALDPSLGYLGGWVDAATGLIYVGNGQYYDPQTGRFLTRDTQPGQLNPYTPGRGDPTSLLIGPLALLVLVQGRKKGRKGSGKASLLLVLITVLLVGGMTLSSCQKPTQPPSTDDTKSTTQPVKPNDGTPNPTGQQGNTPAGTPPPLETPLPPAATCPEAPTSTHTLAPTPTPSPNSIFKDGYYDWAEAVKYASTNWESDKENDCTSFVSYALSAGGLNETETWKPDLGPWVNTTELYNFLDQNFDVLVFPNTQNQGLLTYEILRENDEWSDFLVSHAAEILPGDIVFYWDEEILQTWGHAAIVGDSGDETDFLFKKTGKPDQKPRIYEHSGRTESQPRSLDDTDSTWTKQVAIMQIRPRK